MNENTYNCKIKIPETNSGEVLAELNKCDATLEVITGIENQLIYCEVEIPASRIKEFESWFASEIGGKGEIVIAA